MWRLMNARFLALLSVLVGAVTGLPLSAAQLGYREVEEWAVVLERGPRLANLKIEEVVSHIGLESGEVVADIGAGVGVFSVPLARAVGPTGVVLATEVEAAFLPLIDEKAEEAGVDNIQGVLSEFEDPNLPRRDVGVAFFHDVLHHIEHREAYLQTLATYMAPGSRIVVVDFNMNVQGVTHSNQPEMLISPEQVAGWMANAGFEVTQEIDLFEDKFFVIYTKVD